jgi:hypothetical protein
MLIAKISVELSPADLGEVRLLHPEEEAVPSDACRVHHNVWGSLIFLQDL